MRLALVISSLAMGGAERVMSGLANAWARRGDEVSLITLAGVDRDWYPLERRVARIGLGATGESRHIGAALAANARRWRRLREAVRSVGPDVVVSFIVETNTVTAFALLGTGLPLVISDRTSSTYRPNRFWSLASRLAYPTAGAIVAQTPEAAARTRRLVPRVPVWVIPNPVAVQAGEPLDSVAQAVVEHVGDHEMLLAAGRLTKEKGFDLLLNAFGAVADRHPGWRLVILGEGPERDALEAQVRTLGLQGMASLPGASRSPHALMRHAGLFVLSSRYEGMPNALMEAMAMGVACVSFDCHTGPADLIDSGVNGLLVPAEDVPALAAALARLMDDGPLRRQLGDRGREIQSRLGFEAVLAQWDALFQTLPRRR